MGEAGEMTSRSQKVLVTMHRDTAARDTNGQQRLVKTDVSPGAFQLIVKLSDIDLKTGPKRLLTKKWRALRELGYICVVFKA